MKNNLTETYEFLASIIGNAPFGIIAIDLNGAITMCNRQALDQLSISLKPKDILETLITNHTQDISKLNNRLLYCLEKGRKAFNLNSIIVKDKVLNIKGRPILNGMIITTADITEAKETERKVLNAMLEGQEKERIRLAKEIHDGIGPLMSTIKLNIESVKKELDQSSEKTLKKIDNVEELIQNIATDIRAISHALMPSALKDFGLISALQNLVLKANKAEAFEIDLIHSEMNERLDSAIELGLYRISQELLNNAIKHSKAQYITIQLIKHPDQITLTVEDDGVGFQKEKIQKLVDIGIGLRNIKTRTEAMRGEFSIDTNPGKGVMATIEIPLSN